MQEEQTVNTKSAAQKRVIDAEVQRRWEEYSEYIEDDASGYAMGSYLHWVEDADRDWEDEEETPERRRSRYATLAEWAAKEDIDSYVEGTRYYPSYEEDIAEHAEEMAERRLVRDDDADDLRAALVKSIKERKWEWPGVETASVVAA